jgi:YVTN family beta-propeller protein
MSLLFTILVLAAGLCSIPASAEDTPADALLALSKGDNTLAIVDPSSSRVIARIPVGKDPHEVIASTDGKTAYVSNYGFGAYNTLAVVDLVAQKALPSIDLGPLRGPHGLAFVGGKTWFTAEAAKAIGSYDPSTNRVDWILGTGQNRTHMIYVSADLQRIVTANVSSGTLSIIDRTSGGNPGPPPPGAGPQGSAMGGPPPGGSGARAGSPRPDWDETVVRVGNGSEGFDVSPDGRQIWVANALDGTVAIVDPSTKQVSETLTADVGGANRLKFTLDGRLALISSLRSSNLTVIETTTHKTIKQIPLGHGAAGILLAPDGSRAFVACSPDGYVAIIDLKSLTVTGRIEVGNNPDGLAWARRR